MAIAILGSKINNSDKVITIESGNLRYIDNITKEFEDESDFKLGNMYRDKIKTYSNDNKLVLTYIKNNEEKIELDILFNDEEAIRTRTSSLEDVKSEVERSRKLLLNSKNKMFLTSFLLNKKLLPTTRATVKMTIDEYRNAKKEDYLVIAKDGEYRIPISEVLKYRLNNKKLGSMRLLVEDTLEVWKKNMLNLTDEELYFYSRELRILINEYNYRKIPRKVICNLNFNKEYLDEKLVLRKPNVVRMTGTVGLTKRKIFDDRKAS